MASSVLAIGQVTLTDLNDAIVAGTAPTNPSDGTLWIDTSVRPSVLKIWKNGEWIPQTLDISQLDPDLAETIEKITEEIGNIANDNLVTYSERSVIVDKLMEIIGFVISSSATTMPTVQDLDRDKRGNFYQTRKSALSSGLKSDIAEYIAVATTYNALKSYLESMTPKGWDVSDVNKDKNITVEKNTFRQKWLDYYLACEKLSVATALKLKQNVDDIEVGGRNFIPNGEFTYSLADSRWTQYYIGNTKEIVDISNEKPPHQYAYHVKNTTASNGGIFTPTLFSGAIAESFTDKEIAVSFWLKYKGITLGSQPHYAGRFGEIAIRGLTSTGTYVYTYNQVDLSTNEYKQGAFITGTNETWTQYHGVLKIAIPSGAVKIDSISFKMGIESTVGEFWTTGIKLETGNKVTGYSDDPQDAFTRMTKVEFEITPNSIYGKVKSTSGYNFDLNSKTEDRDFYFNKGVERWSNSPTTITDLTQDPNIVITKNGTIGGNSLKVTNMKWFYYRNKIEVTTERVYRVRMRVRALQAPTDITKAKVYAGVTCFDSTGTYIGNRYCGVNATDLTVEEGWMIYEGIITGEDNTTNKLNNFLVGTTFAMPVFILNYNGGNGIMEIDYCIFEDITLDANLNALGEQVNQAEQKITDSAIINTVTQSNKYQTDLGDKVNWDDLEAYPNKGDLDEALAQVDKDISDRLEALGMSDYVTKAQLEILAQKISFDISRAGGVNLLRNSVGFSGTDKWTISDANGYEFGGVNILTNADFGRLLVQGTWDTTKNGTYVAQNWGGYNGSVVNPTTVYHAHINQDKFKQNVYCFNESDGSRHWKGVINAVKVNQGSKYMFGVDLYTTEIGAKLYGGFYHYNSAGQQAFHGGQYAINPDVTNTWKRYSVPVPMGVDIDITKPVFFYVYGYNFTSNAIMYMKHPKVELGTESTPFQVAPADSSGLYAGTVTTIQNQELVENGAGSGFVFKNKKITQEIPVVKGSYSVGFKIKKTVARGKFSLKVVDTTTNTVVCRLYCGEGETFAYQVQTQAFNVTGNKIAVSLYGDAMADITITDLMVNVGETSLQWSHAYDEIYNANVTMDINGIRVANSATNGYTAITPKEFAGYASVLDENGVSQMEKIFTLNGDVTEVKKIQVGDYIGMKPIKVIPIKTLRNYGWAFVGDNE